MSLPLPPTLPHERARQLLREAGALEGSASQRRARLESWAARHPERLPWLDPLLLHLRRLETAGAGLPPLLGGLRRGRLLAVDAVSSTWEAWDPRSGRRAVLRCLDPALRSDPSWKRRLERGARLVSSIPGLLPTRWRAGDWPHQLFLPPGPPLSSLLPVEDPPEPAALLALLLAALRALAALHERGLAHGHLDADALYLGPRPALLWLDPVLAGRPAAGEAQREDLRAVGRLIHLLDPQDQDPLAGEFAHWAEQPPASAEEATRLLVGAAGELLMAERRRLLQRSRAGRRQGRLLRLLRAARALERAARPPPGRAVLRAGHDGVLQLLESDGRRLLGGAAAAVPPHGLFPVYEPGRGLDARAARALLRAWALRREGDEPLRRRARDAWGASDEAAERLCRWLAARSRLRAALLFLERERS